MRFNSVSNLRLLNDDEFNMIISIYTVCPIKAIRFLFKRKRAKPRERAFTPNFMP